MSRTVSVRSPEETAGRLDAIAKELGLSIEEVSAMMVEEWLRQDEHPEIGFRTFGKERLAYLEGFIRIWKIVMVAQGYDFDAEKTAAHFDVPVHRIQAALDYYRAYPDEADRIIAENDSWTYERLKQVLPNIGITIVPREPADDNVMPV